MIADIKKTRLNKGLAFATTGNFEAEGEDTVEDDEKQSDDPARPEAGEVAQ